MGLLGRDRNSGKKRGRIHQPDMEGVRYRELERGKEPRVKTKISRNGLI